jgi:hypothetical protein
MHPSVAGGLAFDAPCCAVTLEGFFELHAFPHHPYMLNKLRVSISAALLLSPLLAHSVAVTGQGTWEETLEARDLDQNGVVDAFYDKTLNLTWLADAAYIRSNRPTANSSMAWEAASAWAQSLDVGGFSGWRLPTMVLTTGCISTAAGGTDCGANVNIFDPATGLVASEIAHLWYVTLANKAYAEPITGLSTPRGWGLKNTAGFQNWTDATVLWGSEYSVDTREAWYFDVGLGTQNVGWKYFSNSALAVHDGDLAPVPEASSFVLGLAGLAVVACMGQRTRKAQTLSACSGA